MTGVNLLIDQAELYDLRAGILKLEIALQKIAGIPDEMTGGDLDAIECARKIAQAALPSARPDRFYEPLDSAAQEKTLRAIASQSAKEVKP